MKRKLTLREAKYKKTVEAVYGENGPNTHNIQSLQQYALMTPGKLPKIGKYVYNKAKEGLKDKKRGVWFVFAFFYLQSTYCSRSYSTVTTSMTIFNELIKTCHGDLALFAAPVCDMMTILLNSQIIELKAAGTETVRKPRKDTENLKTNAISSFFSSSHSLYVLLNMVVSSMN